MQRIRQINFFFKTIVFNRKLISLPKIQQLETTMLARDLIATVIKTFFEELDDVRDGKRQMNDESPYAGMYASYFNKDRDWFIQADTEEITTFFADDPNTRSSVRLTDAGIQAILYRRSSNYTRSSISVVRNFLWTG